MERAHILNFSSFLFFTQIGLEENYGCVFLYV